MTRMIEMKVDELIGPALAWAVAVAEGLIGPADGVYLMPTGFENNKFAPVWINDESLYAPPDDWRQGGTLIDKYRVGIESGDESGQFYAYLPGKALDGCIGETHLIAACRAIVLAQLGPVVSVPAALAGGV